MNKKPNIIYILGDDHRADYMANMGHPIVKTPNLDYLAENVMLVIILQAKYSGVF